MIKTVTFLKRKPGMSLADFIHYYENHHAPLGAGLMKNPRKYIRRYIHPLGNLFGGEVVEPEFDVITEAWFDDMAAMEANFAWMRRPENIEILAKDEENLFDRDKHRFTTVEEFETDLDAVRTKG